ncbi:GntR family transcriptional regulator [Labedella endophytica]|uniref:GntR family transcriptional regulator n=1 Tax=Labedella endophytica TaxID=1523160 RepID=A0A3S0VUI0_9MICO|nr:GntR family transcriptional regulator [Labedella endophytica]RUR01833.1 GntR family transcriptional regulator [Labedella endophytica]
MSVVVSTSSSTPIYEQISSQLRSTILSGEIAAGQSLPSLRQLAADLRVSIITVTRAYNDLAAEGLVKSEHGRGFVVLEVDPETARASLNDRVDAILTELRSAAIHARLSAGDVHHRLDQIWREDD